MDPKNNAGDLKRTCKAVVTNMAWHPHESWHIDQANRTPKVSACICDQQVFHKGATHTHWRKNNFFNKCCRRLPLESPFIPCTKLTVDQRPEWKTGNYEATKIKHRRDTSGHGWRFCCGVDPKASEANVDYIKQHSKGNQQQSRDDHRVGGSICR